MRDEDINLIDVTFDASRQRYNYDDFGGLTTIDEDMGRPSIIVERE
jgi:hypothetical protein